MAESLKYWVGDQKVSGARPLLKMVFLCNGKSVWIKAIVKS